MKVDPDCDVPSDGAEVGIFLECDGIDGEDDADGGGDGEEDEQAAGVSHGAGELTPGDGACATEEGEGFDGEAGGGAAGHSSDAAAAEAVETFVAAEAEGGGGFQIVGVEADDHREHE